MAESFTSENGKFTLRSTDDYAMLEGEKVLGKNIEILTFAGARNIETTWDKLNQEQRACVIVQLRDKIRKMANSACKSEIVLLA